MSGQGGFSDHSSDDSGGGRGKNRRLIVDNRRQS
jgi:hypothetical protein